MRPPTPSPLTACTVLAALIAICALLPPTPVTAMALAVLIALLATELDREGGLIAVRIVRLACLIMLPRAKRDDFASEWTDHVRCAGENGLRPVLAAGLIACWSAPQLAFHLRASPALSRYTRAIVDAFIYVTLSYASVGKGRPAWHRRDALLVVFVLPALPIHVLLHRRGRQAPWWGLVLVGVANFAIPIATAFVLPTGPAEGVQWGALGYYQLIGGLLFLRRSERMAITRAMAQAGIYRV